ncbi:MAG: type IV pilus assembly protein PilF [Phenylobacterium sp.]|jgi:type IV pilus assembly protein PilF
MLQVRVSCLGILASLVRKSSLLTLLSILLSTLLLTGCVQSSSYKNSGNPVDQTAVDTNEAAKTRIALGLQYLKVGEMGNAKANLEKALHFAPKMPAVHSAFAYYYQKVDEAELAEQAYLKALSYDADDPDTLNNYGVFLCGQKLYDKAEGVFLQAIKVPSYLKVAESYENAALCAMQNKQYVEAKDFFTSSLDHGTLRANTLMNTAGLSYAMGDYRDAQKYTQRLTNIGVMSPRVLLLRALVELKLGDITQSKKYGTTLVSKYVKTPQALAYLSKNFDNTEFEVLRKRYLKDEYQRFLAKQTDKQKADRANNSADKVAVTPKIKKKLKPPFLPSPSTSPSPSPSTLTSTSTQVQANIAPASEAKPQPVIASQPEPANESTVSPMVLTPVTIPVAKPIADSTAGTVIKPIVSSSVDLSQTSGDTKIVTAVPTSAESVVDIEQTSLKASDKSRKRPFHVVKKDEYLYDISVKYNIKLKRLIQWNGLSNKAQVKVGQKIYLAKPNTKPKPNTELTTGGNSYHVIEQGDTLFGLSLRYNILLKKLLQWNELTINAPLKLGQRILIAKPS